MQPPRSYAGQGADLPILSSVCSCLTSRALQCRMQCLTASVCQLPLVHVASARKIHPGNQAEIVTPLGHLSFVLRLPKPRFYMIFTGRGLQQPATNKVPLPPDISVARQRLCGTRQVGKEFGR